MVRSDRPVTDASVTRTPIAIAAAAVWYESAEAMVTGRLTLN